MTLYDFLKYFLGLGSKDLFALVGDIGCFNEQLSAATKLPIISFSLLELICALVLGFFGYKLLKPFLAIVMGGIGFYAGVDFFLTYMWRKSEWMPDEFCYVIAAVPAVIFFIFAAKRPIGGVFALHAIIGAIITSSYTDRTMLIVAGGVLLALITGVIYRFSFITVTSFVGALTSVVTLSQILPTVAILQIKKDNLVSLAVLGVVFVFFITIQMLITRKDRKLLA